MQPTQEAIDRLRGALRLATPIVAVYDAPPSDDFAPTVTAKGHACCFAYFERWRRGETLVIERAGDDERFTSPSRGCPGMQRAFGLGGPHPPWMAHFLTDGGGGAPSGEGLKATPALAQEYLDRARPPRPSGDHVLLGPLRPGQWERVRAVTLFADPDRLSALMTLAAYWSAGADEIAAGFSSGCGFMWRELDAAGRDRAFIGCTDVAMRKYLPPEVLCLTVTPARFARMLDYPPGTFLDRDWWRELLESRGRRGQ
jgi:hypothetical protein